MKEQLSKVNVSSEKETKKQQIQIYYDHNRRPTELKANQIINNLNLNFQSNIKLIQLNFKCKKKLFTDGKLNAVWWY